MSSYGREYSHHLCVRNQIELLFSTKHCPHEREIFEWWSRPETLKGPLWYNTQSKKIPIKGSSPKKFQSMVPNSGFYRFLSTPSAASVDCANSDRVSHGFLFLTVPCVPCQQLASPLENEECIIALSAQFTTEALLRHSFF